MSALVDKQARFAQMIAALIITADKMGYQVTFAEAYRPVAMADYYASQGVGISNSLHIIRLAVDLNLFKDGNYLTTTEDYLPLGLYWESIGGTWGGRFKGRSDGNHFSLEHNGVK